LFFFNYNRINAAIDNDKVEEYIIGIFGKERSKELRRKLQGLSPYRRERAILEALESVLKETHGKYVLPFCIKDDDKNRTSHYLIFVTKKFKGYDIMKEIMAKFSMDDAKGVPSFEFNKRKEISLFDNPLKDLKSMLVAEYAGKTDVMSAIYEHHSVGKIYIKRNYKKVLCDLLQDGKIDVRKPDGTLPRKGTMPDDCIITFKRG